jgi:phosphatidylglycerophosphate synthase
MKFLLIKYLQVRRKNGNLLKNVDAWSTVFLFDPIAIPLTKVIARTKITPNQISVSRLFPSVLAAVLLLSYRRDVQILGAITVYLTFLMDCVDGKLARLKHVQSEFGRKIDYLCDSLGKLIALLSLVYSQFYIWAGTKAFILGMGLLCSHYLFHLLYRIVIKTEVYRKHGGCAELVGFRRRIAENGLLPFLYTHCEERHLLLIVGPMLGIFRECLVVSLLISLVLIMLPALTIVTRGRVLDRLKT